MGKHNLANRTKNNARPSSSGRSAAALSSALPQFGGFSALKDSSGLSAFTFGPIEEFDSSVEESFQLVIKKISKKDSTTKLKGLQEFAELIENAGSEAVKAVLPIWPRLYNVLATDPDNRVREATHNVHRKIVNKVKRNIAPYLKQLIAPWFTSQYDNYPPAASAAVQAFKDTFSEAKFQEAIIFCQDEILTYVHKILSIHMDKNIASNVNLTQEEAEAKYERLLISCLQGYSLYLQKVPADKIKEADELNSNIVLNKRFWKLATNKISLIRTAWFQVLSVILQKVPFLLKEKDRLVLITTLNNLEDDDPLVVPHIWECLLLATTEFSEWWNYIDIGSLLIPKLIKVLQQAGKGNASIIYPNLLPLLSNLPPMTQESATQFYNNFFEAMRLGLKLKSLSNSKSEVTSIASAFIECLQFLIIKNSSDVDMCKSLMKNQLVSITEWCITDKVSYYKPIFYQIAMFVQYLSRSNNPVSLQSLVNFYFDNVQQIVGNLLEPDLNIAIISERQIELVRSLKHSHRPKKLSHVTFMLSDDEKIHSDKKGPANARQNETYFKLIDQLAVNIFQEYTKYVTAKSSRHLVDQMCSLVMEFSNNEAMFFDSLNIKFMDIYENLFKKWLMSDEIYCKSVINLLFLLITYLDDHEKEIVLNDLSKNNQPNCLMWSISTALSYPYIESTVVQKWLREEKIGKFFISIAEKQISDECSPELGAILKLALTENRNGDIFITKDVLTQIIEKIWSTLLADKDKVENLDSCSRLASHLCSIIYTDTLLLTYGDQLLLTLIQTTCKFQHENDSLSLETICEIKSAWQDALIILLSNLPMSDSEMIVSQIAVTIEDQFFLTSVTDKEQMKHLASVIVMCVSAFCKSQSHMVSSLIDIIFKRTWTARGKTIEQICKIAEYVKGTMGSPYEELVLPDSLNEKEILQYFIWCFIKLYTLSSELNVSSQFDDSPIVDEDCEDLPSHERLIDVIKTEENYLLHALYFHSVGKSFLTHFTNVKYYKEIYYYNSWVEERLRELFLSTNKDTVTELKAELKNKCFKFGWFWCRAAFDFYTGFSDEMTCLSAICNEVIEDRSDTSPLGVVHVNQIFKNDELSTDLSSENVKDTAGKWMDQMQTLKQENIPEFLYDNPYKVLWEKAEKIIESVRLCSKLIEHCPLSRTYWDFVVISLASWTSNCLKARELVHSKYQYQAMLISVSELYVNICDKVAKFKEFNENTNFVNEWEDVLLETIHDDFAQIWLYLAERLPTESENTIINLPFLQYFGPVTERLRHDFIFKSKDNFPKWTKFLKKGCSLLTNSRTILQLWGYRMLKILVPGLVKIDYEAVDNRTPHEKGLIFEQFKDKLTEVQIVVNSVLMDFRVGENTCKVEPSYDSFTYTVAYLLLWDVMLCLSEEASAELRYQYAEWLKNGKFLNYFLSNLFKLIPPEIYQSNEGKTKFNDCFLESPLDYTSSYNKFFDSETIEQMVCYLYKTSLVQLPALVRQWWTDLEVKASQLVDKITTIYVSPHLCLEELNNVVNHQNAFKNMKVKVMVTIREILAVYTVDETQMELTITLPLNYPLGSPTIQCNKQISGANQKQWLLQFKKCVLHQNGRIWDGLSLWNNNLDRKFDGVEECFICYAVLHYGTCQLPKLCCQTCKKKFHSACLYKWFSTSNKSSCPICRNLF